MNVLVVDVGGTHVKLLATGQSEPRQFVSGPTLTVEQMVAGVKEIARDWSYDVVAVGYPGAVLHGRPVAEPHNLVAGWVRFDYESAFGCPVKVINDAAMQALGSYKGGKLLFLGLGTGLGSTMIVEGIVEPMELGHLPYRKGTYEDYVGARGLERVGKKRWRRYVAERRRPPDRRARTRQRRLGGWKRQETERAACRLPSRRQRQCLPGRISPLGGTGVMANLRRRQGWIPDNQIATPGPEAWLEPPRLPTGSTSG